MYCHWIENGLRVQQFIDIVPLKSTAESIYSASVGALKLKNTLMINGLEFDGATLFSGKTLVFRPWPEHQCFN